ncbi:MAG: YcgN family cysteine cluster protein [Thiotrichaceae bacterium]
MSDAWWDKKRLSELTDSEWEQLCDHCGKCCLLKLEDEDSGDVYYTDVACKLINKDDCSCSRYTERERLVPDCLKLTKDNLEQISWMPLSCAYRRIMEGRGLPKWHHLVCGDKSEIHRQGYSVVGRFVYEGTINDDEMEERIVEWPLIDGNH